MKYSFFIQHFDYLEIEPFQVRKMPQQNKFIIICIKIQNQRFLALKPFFLRKFIAKKVLWLNITKWPFICHKYIRYCFTAVFCEKTCTCSITLIKLWNILPHIENRKNYNLSDPRLFTYLINKLIPIQSFHAK